MSAPASDLRFLNKLSEFKNNDIRMVTTEAFRRHLWYLSEVTVGLALFDRNVTIEEKKSMITQMKERVRRYDFRGWIQNRTLSENH